MDKRHRHLGLSTHSAGFAFAFALTFALAILFAFASSSAVAQDADLILRNGKIATVDPAFSIREAMAVRDGRVLAVGSNEEIDKTKGARTQVVDLGGKLVLPGLIDSHVHPSAASMIEFDHPVPAMETIPDVLKYIGQRAKALPEGEWIVVQQVFITRLKEQRYPTRAELDDIAPRHPVVFRTGPDASLSSLALKLSGIDKDFRVEGAGRVERDPKTGEPTGILRNCSRYIKSKPYSGARKATAEDRDRQLLALMADYASVGITSIIDRDASPDEIERYRGLGQANRIPLRVAISHHIETTGDLEKVLASIRKVASHPLRPGSDELRIVGIKTYLDGGMLTGSAYMRQPWGLSKIYAIDDPDYRGVLFIPKERLAAIVRETVKAGLQFTAHSVGDGAVHALLDAYEEVNREIPVATTRPCVTHSNFMSREAIDQAKRLGVVVDIQPIWLHLDGRTLTAQFGDERMTWFQPLKSLLEAGVTAGGGSDHMQKIGSLRSINPYNPFLGMWIAVTRTARGLDRPVHREQALSREQAIRFYTINNAKLMFLEDRIGSLEPGKYADFAIIDRDLLTCPADLIKEAQAVATYRAGKLLHSLKDHP